jgi:Contractile injection system tube protein
VERVIFLTEPSQDRITALLNPESLVMRRSAGTRALRSVSGPLTSITMADDPLLFTGGGRTELELALLFDVNLVDANVATSDVRDLTRPLWNLSENQQGSGYGQPALARMVWGKAWNFLGAVTAIAERLERFDVDGAPTRSWVRLRMVRCGDVRQPDGAEGNQPGSGASVLSELPAGGESEEAYRVIGAGPASDQTVGGERLDAVASSVYGSRPWLWRLLADANSIDDPTNVAPGTILRVPPVPPGMEAPT